jgi:hypothetical protein
MILAQFVEDLLDYALHGPILEPAITFLVWGSVAVAPSKVLLFDAFRRCF